MLLVLTQIGVILGLGFLVKQRSVMAWTIGCLS